MNDNKINELLNSKNDNKKINEFINTNLSDTQKNQLNDILSDKDKIKRLLESDKAQEIIKKFIKE